MGWHCSGLLGCCLVLGLVACSQEPQEAKAPVLNPQFGAPGFGHAVVVSNRLGAVFVVADTFDGIGATHILRRYNRDGSLEWQRDVASTYDGSFHDMALAPGNSLIMSVFSEYVANLYKYSPSGQELWRSSVEGPEDCADSGFSYADEVDVSTDGSIFVKGSPIYADCDFITKLNSAGQPLWAKSLGYHASDIQVAADGSTYAVGRDGGRYGPGNIIVSKHSASGTLIWKKTLVRGNFTLSELEVASDGFYFAGSKHFGEDAAETDALIAKVNLNGTLKWLRTFGSTSIEGASALTLDKSGNVYVTGSTEGRMSEPNQGETDIFVRKYTPTASVVWTRQLGSSGSDQGVDIAAMQSNELYLTGSTAGDLGAGNQGDREAFLMRTNGGGFKVWVR